MKNEKSIQYMIPPPPFYWSIVRTFGCRLSIRCWVTRSWDCYELASAISSKEYKYNFRDACYRGASQTTCMMSQEDLPPTQGSYERFSMDAPMTKRAQWMSRRTLLKNCWRLHCSGSMFSRFIWDLLLCNITQRWVPWVKWGTGCRIKRKSTGLVIYAKYDI